MQDVGSAEGEPRDLGGVDIEPDDRDAGVREMQRERETDVAEAGDGDGALGRGCWYHGGVVSHGGRPPLLK